MPELADSEQKKRRITLRSIIKPRIRWLLWLAILPVLWLVFRQIDLARLLSVLGNLSFVEILLLLLLNSLVILSLSARWWLILRGKGVGIRYGRLSLYRLAAFSISYFTPGPQFGGEPFQIQLLRSRHRMAGVEASASVALDKSLELAVNFGFLVFGVVVVAAEGLLPGRGSLLLLVSAVGLLLIPLLHLWVAARGHRPLAWLLGEVSSLWPDWAVIARTLSLVEETESQVAGFLQERPGWVGAALAVSMFSWLLLIAEYWLMARFLGIDISIWLAIAALTAARLAILLPSPGGLGTLEASQVLAFSSLAGSPNAGAALALIIRARDLIFGGLGLLLVGRFGGEAIAPLRDSEGGHRRQAGG
ncbi:MAG: lysylphosphatidylglycerol synthase transmembrane domain-containing protein [Anaerolineales bacterium]